MILRNAYLTFHNLMFGATQYVLNVNGGVVSLAYPERAWKFGEMSSGSYAPSMYHVNTSYAQAGGGVIFGNGNNPPSYWDVKLSGDVISTIVASASVTPEKLADGTLVITALYTVTNTGETDITISEIGAFARSKSGADQAYAVLVERTVLDSPITIEPGGVGQVTYTVRLSFPFEG